MERRTVFTCLLCCLLIVTEAHSAPLFFPEPDCYQPTGAPYDQGYNYQEPDYEKTLQEVLRAIQEIVYLAVRAAKEELDQLTRIWLPPCDTGEYPGGGEGAVPQEISGETWVQSDSSSQTSQHHTEEESTLNNRVGDRNDHSSSSSSYSSTSSSDSPTNGTRTTITITNTTVTHHKHIDGSSSGTPLNTIGDSSTTIFDDIITSEYVTEETTTGSVTSSDTK